MGTEIEKDDTAWFSRSLNKDEAVPFGVKISGGGIHQSKTMMLAEIRTLLSTWKPHAADPKKLIVESNVLSKRTISTRKLTFNRLNRAGVFASRRRLKAKPTY
jgi:hypothetical protein